MILASFPICSASITILQVLGSLGIFLYGMKIMSEGVQKVAGDRMRAALAGMTSTRVRGITTGFFMTTLVQSSSAAMAITITCALNGWLGDIETNALGVFQNSAAIVLGENIGTTVTAWLASTGANVHAKRAARAHFTFNIIGIVWCMAVFYPFSTLVWNLAQHLPEGLRSANQNLAQSEIAFATAHFNAVDTTSYNLAHEIEDQVDILRKRNNKAAAERMQEVAMVQTELIFIDFNNHMEAVANHMLNIIQASPRIRTDSQ